MMKLSVKARFQLLVCELEKIPEKEAGEFSPEYVAAVLKCPLKYAQELFREWLKGENPHFYGMDKKEFYTVSNTRERSCISVEE